MTEELTLSIIKPDAVKRNLTGKINSIFESNNLSIVAQKMILLSKLDAERFYGVHKERAFFNDLCDYMTSGPIIVQVLKGKNAVMKNRDLMGATNPANAEDNTQSGLWNALMNQEFPVFSKDKTDILIRNTHYTFYHDIRN